MKLRSIHTRELPVAPEEVGALLDGLGSPGDRLWPSDRWPTTPLEIDGRLAVGAQSRQGLFRLTQIRQVVDEYVPGRRIAFRFAPGLGIVGAHRLAVEPLGQHRSRLTHTLEDRLEPKMIPVYPILIRQHDALVEDLFDRAELITTGRIARPARWPASVRIANTLELAIARSRGLLPAPRRASRDRLTRSSTIAVSTVSPGRWLSRRRSTMRLPKTAHTSRPWRVHELTQEFELEDVWELPTPGGPGDLARLVQWFTAPDDDGRQVLDGAPVVFRALFALRWKLGRLFGWDEPEAGIGRRVRSLRDRLPRDLLEAPRGPDLRSVPGRPDAGGQPVFSSVYQTHDEWLTEFTNKTVHSLMHIGWVPDASSGGYHAQMAVLVTPNGWLGKAYMAAIKPIRYALVYPMLLRSIERQWQMRAARDVTTTGGSR